MPPSRTSLDPEGHYACLGVEPSASQAAIVTAYRAKARVLHPDVPNTGNAAAFVAVKRAYDVVSNPRLRAAYDRAAAAVDDDDGIEVIEPAVVVVRPAEYQPASMPPWRTWFADLPVMVWAGLATFLCLCLYEATSHLLAPAQVPNAGIRPNAATVQPLSPSASRAVLYGPTPVRLGGTPNFYVRPSGTPAILWRMDNDHNNLAPIGQLPPFSVVQAVRLVRQNGMLEVVVNDQMHGFISADHLTPGDAAAAKSAYCGYNAGPIPYDGELLERRGYGNATLAVENRAVQPAVVKLRDAKGSVAVAVFLGPGAQADLHQLPDGLYRTDFAIGELWSRGCNMFAAGMRAWRMNDAIKLPGEPRLILAPDGQTPGAGNISDQAFQQD